MGLLLLQCACEYLSALLEDGLWSDWENGTGCIWGPSWPCSWLCFALEADSCVGMLGVGFVGPLLAHLSVRSVS